MIVGLENPQQLVDSVANKINGECDRTLYTGELHGETTVIVTNFGVDIESEKWTRERMVGNVHPLSSIKNLVSAHFCLIRILETGFDLTMWGR